MHLSIVLLERFEVQAGHIPMAIATNPRTIH